MESSAQDIPGYYVWQVPGKPITVHLSLDVVDRISNEVMRGFAAIPKRGAEVGGVLVGSVEITSHEAKPDDPEPPEFSETAIVRIDSFEAVPCQYSRGPSYLFSDIELISFANTLAQLESDPFSSSHPVGYFRSHTREGMSLAPEDIALLDEHFTDPAHLALLIKPFATKVSVAGFFYREEGEFPAETGLEFPFRRREITGEAPPPRRSMTDRQPRGSGDVDHAIDGSARETPRMDAARAADAVRQQLEASQSSSPFGELPADITFPPPPEVRKRRWTTLVPVSLIFLVLGLALGFQASISLWPELRGDDVKNVALRLTVSRSGDNLTIRWNRDAIPVKSAQRGVLEIEDNGNLKPVELDAAHLHDGTVVYQSNSAEVRFRLVVYLTARLTVAETVDWKQ
jgi:hypothetical protein